MTNLNQTKNRSFTITKRIAKHGNQSIIVIPRMLEQHLKPGMVVQLGINVIENFQTKLDGEEK